MAPGNVDARLVRLAQELDAKLVTNDYNLNRVAHVEGVAVLNVNELANAVKPVVLPGEELHVAVIREGKEGPSRRRLSRRRHDDRRRARTAPDRRRDRRRRDQRVADGRRPHDLRAPEARGRRIVKWAAVIVAAGRGHALGAAQAVYRAGGSADGRLVDSNLCGDAGDRASSSSRPSRSPSTRCARWPSELAPECAQRVVRGGATRQEQRARRRCAALARSCEAVLVHDGARPLVTRRRRARRNARGARRARRAAGRRRSSTRSRSSIRNRGSSKRRSIARAVGGADAAVCDRSPTCARRTNARVRDGVAVTDDAALLERIGIEVVVGSRDERELQGDASGRRRARRSDLARARVDAVGCRR